MREIKFRGHNGFEWIYSEIVANDTDYLNGETREIGHMCTGDIEDWENGWQSICYPGQYTGLKDKDGKEIYEGDIVKFNAIAPMSNIPDGFTGKVEWLECAFYVTYGKQGFYLFDECQEWEVIGNIYENPELAS